MTPLPALFAASFVSVPAVFTSCEALESDWAKDLMDDPKTKAAVKITGVSCLTVVGIFIA